MNSHGNPHPAGGKTKRAIAKNFLWLFFGGTGSRFLKALIILYAARVLGAEGYGIFSYALALGGLFIFFKNIGVDTILTREVAKKKEKEEESRHFATSLWIEFGLLAITALAIIFIAPLLSTVKAATLLLPLVVLVLIFDDLRDFFVAYFRGKERMELEALALAVANVAMVGLGLLALHLFGTPFAFMVAYAAASALSVVAIIGFLKPVIFNIVRDFTKEKVLPILNASWPLAVGGFASVFLFNVDIVMLGWWRTPDDIGLYSAAQRLVGISAFFSGLVATATFPALSRFARNEAKEQFKTLFEGAVRIILLISIPFAAGGLVLGKSLIGFIFGPDFVPSFTVFAIFLFSVLVIHPMPIFSNLILAFNKQAKTVFYAFIAAFLNIVLNIILIPPYGIVGAAITTLIAFLVYNILFWRFSKKLADYQILSGLPKILLSAILMGLFAFTLQYAGIHVLVNVIISSAFYFAALHFLKEKTLTEAIELVQRLRSAKA